jgi:ribosomal protein S18 acetylase RimI-like enzyme
LCRFERRIQWTFIYSFPKFKSFIKVNATKGALQGLLESCQERNRVLSMIIERATVRDGAEILALQKVAYWSEAKVYNDFNIPPLVQTLESMEEDFKNQLFLKALVDGRIIGSVRAYSKEGTCYIGRLVVHPDFQNRGIGTSLMNEIERIFYGCKRFELFTGDRSERNLHLYQKRGYQIFNAAKMTDRTNIVFLEKKGEIRG